MNPRYLGLATVLGLLVSGSGIIAPIVWAWYKTRSALEVRVLSNTVVVKPSQELKKLQFVYAGKPVPCVSRVELALTNTGRTPIRKSDVVTPVVLRIKNGAILDAEVIKVVPDDLLVSGHLPSTGDAVTVEFSLLNPGDSANITLLVAAERADVAATARIAGVSKLSYVEELNDSPANRRRRPWSFIIVGVMTCFSGLLFFLRLHMTGSESEIAILARRNAIAIPAFETAPEYRNWLNQTFVDKKVSELKRVHELLMEMPQDRKLDEQERMSVTNAVMSALTDVRIARVTLALFGILFAIGATYVWLAL